jgi:hypothetical protein
LTGLDLMCHQVNPVHIQWKFSLEFGSSLLFHTDSFFKFVGAVLQCIDLHTINANALMLLIEA